jgi:hypothetical protein
MNDILKCPVGEPGPMPEGLDADSDQDCFVGFKIENGIIHELSREELLALTNS